MIIVKIGLFELGFYAILSKKSYAEYLHYLQKQRLNFFPLKTLYCCVHPKIFRPSSKRKQEKLINIGI